jgi:hypothetical protein
VKTRILFPAVLAVVLASAVPASAQISADERAKAIDLLNSTRDQVLAEAAKLTDAQWSFKQAPDRWSVGEVVEHLALSESFLFDSQQKLAGGPAASAELRKSAEGKDAVILKTIPDRTQKANAPEPIQPKARLGTQAQVLQAFRERRATTIAYTTKTNDDLRSRVSDSPPFGAVDSYQWLLFIAAHTQRHLAQIKEVKSDPKVPK